MADKAYIFDEFKKYSLDLSDEQVDRLYRYFELLVEWNARINLTSITDYPDVVRKHFLDSALLFAECDESTGSCYNHFVEYIRDNGIRLLDVGSGAGFPGMVIAILKPEWDVVLLDSLNKRIDFLNTVIRECGLMNVKAVQGRAETFGRDPAFRVQFDLCVARAVSELRSLLEYCIPFVKDSGFFVAYKGPGFEENDEGANANHALFELNARICFLEKFELVDGIRYLVGVERDGDLPDKYPRRDGIPGKRPL